MTSDYLDAFLNYLINFKVIGYMFMLYYHFLGWEITYLTSVYILWHRGPSKIGVYSERKKFAPKGVNSFLQELTTLRMEAKMKI